MGLQGRGQCWKQGEHLRGSCNNSRHDTKAALTKVVEVKMGKERTFRIRFKVESTGFTGRW